MPVSAVLVSAVLFIVDQLSRSLRLWQFGFASGSPITLLHALGVTLIGDAGAGLTPLHLGADPARLGALRRFGVPGSAAVVILAADLLASWPPVLVAAVGLAATAAPDWWGTVGQRLSVAPLPIGLWLVALLLILTVSLLAAWHLGRRVTGPKLPSFARIRVYWRRLGRGPIALGMVLTVVSIAARVAMLPALLTAAPSATPLLPTLLASFAVQYSQLLLPTPSGAGIVDLGLLAGVAGDLGGSAVTVLVLWRFFATGLPIGLGLGVGALYGLSLAWRRPGQPQRKRATPPARQADGLVGS